MVMQIKLVVVVVVEIKDYNVISNDGKRGETFTIGSTLNILPSLGYKKSIDLKKEDLWGTEWD